MRATSVIFFLAIVLSVFVLGNDPARAHDIRIDTQTAKAVLNALGDPSLTQAQAKKIARLPGNKLLTQKMLTYGDGLGEARLIHELLAAARGETLADNAWYGFEAIKDNRLDVLETITDIETNLDSFVQWLNDRIEIFSPEGPSLQLTGFLIAGGRPTGFALGGSEFCLNITRFPHEPEAVKVITAHELFHSVQTASAIASERTFDRTFDMRAFQALQRRDEKHRYLLQLYLLQLLYEGSASYVGDVFLLTDGGEYSTQAREEIEGQLGRAERLTALLDMALIALTADDPISYEDAYGVGFYGPDQPLYALAYNMSKVISEKSGASTLAALTAGDGCEFAEAYIELTEADPGLIRLGPATERMVAQYCP